MCSAFLIPSIFPRFSDEWLQDEFLDEGLHVVVEAHEAAAEEETHVPADVGNEAVGVVDNVLFPLLVGSLGDDDFKSELEFNRNYICLIFGLKNGLRFHFDSETCLNDPFLNIFLVWGILSQNSSDF